MPDHPPETVLWKLVLYQRLNNQEIQNIFYFTNTNLIPQDNLPQVTSDVLTEFTDTIENPLQAAQTNHLFWTRLTCTAVIPHNGPVAQLNYPLVEGGAQEGTPVNTFCAAVMAKLTGFSGRTNRGRWYFAGLTEAGVFEDALSDFEFDHFANLRLVMLQKWTGRFPASSRMYQVLYSHKDGDTPLGPSYLGVKIIKNLEIRRQVYTQRHRLVGHGS